MPRAGHEPTVLGSVRGLGFGVTPRVLVSIDDFTYKAFDLYGRSYPSQRALTFGETDSLGCGHRREPRGRDFIGLSP